MAKKYMKIKRRNTNCTFNYKYNHIHNKYSICLVNILLLKKGQCLEKIKMGNTIKFDVSFTIHCKYLLATGKYEQSSTLSSRGNFSKSGKLLPLRLRNNMNIQNARPLIQHPWHLERQG